MRNIKDHNKIEMKIFLESTYDNNNNSIGTCKNSIIF